MTTTARLSTLAPMNDSSELKQAVALLACAMTSGAVLSACKKSEAQPAPTVNPESSAAQAMSDVEGLRRAAEVVSAWHRRDPAQTERVLREVGIFACDANTTACIAARQTYTVPPTPAAAQVDPPTPAAALAAPTEPVGVRVPTQHPAVRHPNDRRPALA